MYYVVTSSWLALLLLLLVDAIGASVVADVDVILAVVVLLLDSFCCYS